jgi:acyl-[acyl-carrier-protein]-phospholipid O-acyltransferase / long-chain-fatty-acid--[acyl-carrier-protein] ligase
MSDESLETEPTRRQWIGFWSMIAQQTQNAFNDKLAQFTLIPLGGAVGFALVLPLGPGLAIDVPSAAGLLIALPFILFAPIAGWASDRFSKRDVMLGAAVAQVLVLAWIAMAVMLKSLPLALWGFFALAVQSAFFGPAKIGINKELVGSRHLGFAVGIQQMTAMLAILCGQIVAGWWFDRRFSGRGGLPEMAWEAALGPLIMLMTLSLPALALAMAIPRVPAQGHPRLTPQLAVSHFVHLKNLWRDAPLRRASFGVAFFWGFAAFINLWSVKLAAVITGGGEGFGTLSSIFMAAASLGMAAGFGAASFLLRKRIELGWVPAAGAAMTGVSLAIAFTHPGGWTFLVLLGLLAFFAAIFLAPLNAWMQDRYPPEKRGELQSAVNLQDCLAGVFAVVALAVVGLVAKSLGVAVGHGFRVEIGFIALVCGAMTWFIIRLLPADFIRLIGGIVIRRLYRIRVLHPERLPARGGALLLPNHVSFADGFFISAACPRPVRFVMDEAFMASRAIRIFTRIFNTVTIRRDQPREAIRITIDALRSGDVVCLFPEGQLTRTGTLCELRRGFELIARKAGHPLIPLWCDGSWDTIFSFEGRRFFRKFPRRAPGGMRLAFGEEIPPGSADLACVRDGLLLCAATAIGERFSSPRWKNRVPAGLVAREGNAPDLRRIWANAYQISQVNALLRRQTFHALTEDLAAMNLPGLFLAFPDLSGARLEIRDEVAGPGVWVGGEHLRGIFETPGNPASGFFYDFSRRATEPLVRPGLLHLPCLAIGPVVISMSMPDPPEPADASDIQRGNRPGTWGRLLPGWYLQGSRVHGPAAPEGGIELPPGAFLDAEGFICHGVREKI